jgi:iron complex outermembrane receptor protein
MRGMARSLSPLRITAAAATLAACTPAYGQIPDAPARLPEFFVPGGRVGRLDLVVPRGDLRPPEANIGPALLALPGVYGQSRATDAMEPNIRGLGFDRVATTLNGLPLFNASPERTNSPVAVLGPAAVTRIVVSKALPSVTLGPVTTAGAISLTTLPESRTGPPAPFSGVATVTFSGAREGIAAHTRIAVNDASWRVAAGGFQNHLGDYLAADGRRVAAKLQDEGASAGWEWHSEIHRVELDILHRRLARQDAVSLPLDGKNSDYDALTMTYRWSSPRRGALRRIDARLGYSASDPYITSEDRSGASLTFANANTRGIGAGLSITWRPSECDTAVTGIDYADQDRSAVRTTPAGFDYIWPGVQSADLGVFAEWTRLVSPRLTLRLGGRADAVDGDAREVDRLALGRTIREQFVTYNGPAAKTVQRRDIMGAANALLTWTNSDRISAFIGTGVSAQPPPPTERYRAFLNALGGDGRGGNAVELGNPALAPERKIAVETGGIWHTAHIDWEATLYYYRVNDFILRTPVGFTPAPLPHLVVFGYRNVLADFFGGELGGTFKPRAGWSIPVTLGAAGGRNCTGGRGLAELPPWEATAATRYRRSGPFPLAADAGMRICGSKDNPAPFDNPLFGRTGGFVVWHVRLGAGIGDRIKAEAGIENLFNRRYTEYLSPPVAPARPSSGDLRPGDRIPAAGRSVWVSVGVAW